MRWLRLLRLSLCCTVTCVCALPLFAATVEKQISFDGDALTPFTTSCNGLNYVVCAYKIAPDPGCQIANTQWYLINAGIPTPISASGCDSQSASQLVYGAAHLTIYTCWDVVGITTFDCGTQMQAPPGPLDTDNDGIPDSKDNCSTVANPDQANQDGDVWGDACEQCDKVAGVQFPPAGMSCNGQDNDADDDGVLNKDDACDKNPKIQNKPQQMTMDPDLDCVHVEDDNCPNAYNPLQVDTDGAGQGNECDDDDDNDGLSDQMESQLGTDPLNADSDGDGLTDLTELTLPMLQPRQFANGSPYVYQASDPLQADTDGDGLTDGDEVKTRGTNPVASDTDGDGMTDGQEVSQGLDPTEADSDHDGLTDQEETTKYPSNPLIFDTDGDGLSDGDEVKKYFSYPTDPDHDKDLVNDGAEILQYGTDPNDSDTDNDGLDDGQEINVLLTNPKSGDTDGDTLPDGNEVQQLGTNPTKADTDDDGLTDSLEINSFGTDPKNADTDGDGVSDGDEDKQRTGDPTKADQAPARATLPPSGGKPGAGTVWQKVTAATKQGQVTSKQAAIVDSDDDQLSDSDEIHIHKTDPRKADTDGDGINDWKELQLGTNPLKADSDNDGLDDWSELNAYKTSPVKMDTDGDGVPDGKEIKYQFSPTKSDTDGDGTGDLVEFLALIDVDGDSVENPQDNCPKMPNPLQQDQDKDGVGDHCDPDLK